MIWQPLIPVWLILAIAAASLALVVWQAVIHRRKKSVLVAWIRRAGIIILISIMSFGPSIPGKSSEAGMLNLNVIFAIDTTTSMGAEDYVGEKERIEGVRSDIAMIAEKLTGARFGVITFDSSAVMQLPMTTDQASLDSLLGVIDRETFVYSQGSSIDKPIELITKQVENNKKAASERPNVVFYFGDGEQTTKDPVTSFAALGTLVDSGAVFGYGTTAGGEMRRYSQLYMGDKTWATPADNQLIQDYSTYGQVNGSYGFQNAVSKIDETALKKVAEEMGVNYDNRNNGGSIDSFIDSLDLNIVAEKGRTIESYTPLYYVIAPLIGGLFVWEVLYLRPHIRNTRRTEGVDHV